DSGRRAQHGEAVARQRREEPLRKASEIRVEIRRVAARLDRIPEQGLAVERARPHRPRGRGGEEEVAFERRGLPRALPAIGRLDYVLRHPREIALDVETWSSEMADESGRERAIPARSIRRDLARGGSKGDEHPARGDIDAGEPCRRANSVRSAETCGKRAGSTCIEKHDGDAYRSVDLLQYGIEIDRLEAQVPLGIDVGGRRKDPV